AKRAGVDPAWVERFEGPIVWERAGMATRAQRARLVRPRLGTSSLSLGDAVRANLRRRKVTVPPEQLDAAWDAVRRARGRKWVVRLALPGARRGLAEWEFDSESERLTALNHLAAELGWVEPRRRR
ncbi:MAG: septation protein SepH, partial [Actinomycetota bacterium]